MSSESGEARGSEERAGLWGLGLLGANPSSAVGLLLLDFLLDLGMSTITSWGYLENWIEKGAWEQWALEAESWGSFTHWEILDNLLNLHTLLFSFFLKNGIIIVTPSELYWGLNEMQLGGIKNKSRCTQGGARSQHDGWKCGRQSSRPVQYLIRASALD